MDKKLKAKWVKALRSGKYKQARQVMKGPDGHCCLGVLSEVAFGKMRKAKDNEVLSAAALKVCGLTGEIQDKLTNWNDGDNWNADGAWSFKRIATWIEKNL